jgi:molybdopterin/thiamine biosynthesis adenylyltransferase
LERSGKVIAKVIALKTQGQTRVGDRYSRQVLFKEIGAEGQAKLLRSRVVIIGCGATGSVLASLLARAGVGTLRIIDRDYVEASNLQRQSLFDENDAAESKPKAIAAAQKIAAFNSSIVVEPRVEDLIPENVDSRSRGCNCSWMAPTTSRLVT